MAAFTSRISIAIVVALALSPLIRDVTAGLTDSIGKQWPFVLEHCRTTQTPGCLPAAPHPFLASLAVR